MKIRPFGMKKSPVETQRRGESIGPPSSGLKMNKNSENEEKLVREHEKKRKCHFWRNYAKRPEIWADHIWLLVRSEDVWPNSLKSGKSISCRLRTGKLAENLRQKSKMQLLKE